MKKGLDILIDKCEELNIEFNISKINLNYDGLVDPLIKGFIKIKTPNGNVDVSLENISTMYGNLTFFYLNPEEAIDQILDILTNNTLKF
jgi:hypothetical protein